MTAPLHVFWVLTTHVGSRSARQIWWYFETDAADVANFAGRLNRGELVAGHRLKWRWADDGSGDVEIVDAIPQTIAREEIRRIDTVNRRLVRVEVEEGVPS